MLHENRTAEYDILVIDLILISIVNFYSKFDLYTEVNDNMNRL